MTSRCVNNVRKIGAVYLYFHTRNSAWPMVNYATFFLKSSTHRALSSLNSLPEKYISLNTDPNKFGQLNSKHNIEEVVNLLPEEKGDKYEVNFADDKERKKRLRIKQYADMIKGFLAEKKLNDAIDVLEVTMLKEHNARPDNYIYNLLINGCAKVGFTKKAFKLYNEMKRRGLKATGATYTSLFNSCALGPVARDGASQASHLLSLLTEKGVILNQSNYHAAIKAFARCGDIATAFRLVDKMVVEKVPITAETFSFLFQSCISDKHNGFRHALVTWLKMRQKNVKPSIFCYNLMLRSARDCDGTEGINPLIRSLGRNQLLIENPNHILLESSSSAKRVVPTEHSSPDSINVNLLSNPPQVDSIVSVNDVSQPHSRLLLIGGCRGFLRQMMADEVKPDIKTITLMLDVIPSNIEFENELLEVCKEFKIKIDVDFCNMLIKKRIYRKDFKNAMEVLRLLKQLKLTPNLITFGVLSLSCNTTEQVNRFLADLEDSGYRLNTEILGGLFGSCIRTWNIQAVMMLMDIMLQQGLKADSKIIDKLLKFKELVVHGKKLKEKGDAHHRMLDHDKFLKAFDRFQIKLEMWKKFVEIDDRCKDHPWKQYWKPKKTSSS